MSDAEAQAAQATIEAFLLALDRGDLAAASALLLPGATFMREVEGAALNLDPGAWFAAVRARDPDGVRNALMMSLTADAAAFKVDTRLLRETLTDRVLLRRDAAGWRVASILSY